MRMHFLNKLPEYMLVIQLVQDRGSQLHFGLCSLYHSCEIQLWVLVVFLHHSELHRVAFQDDWIASRMKNSAKMHLHLFTQTNENSRIFTQYRCHFRKSIFSVVEYCSACSTSSSPPPPFLHLLISSGALHSHFSFFFRNFCSVLSLSST